MFTIAVFFVVLGVLIFVHELGHFLAAKAVGIGVPRFSIGFGPPTPLQFRRGETEYVIAWIPLGGYVKMASKEELEEMSKLEGGETAEEWPEDKLFENKPLWARMMVISAGVTMNTIFAFLAYAGIAGFVGRAEDSTTHIARVEAAGLPSAAEGLLTLPEETQVLRVNGDTIRSWNILGEKVMDRTSARLRFEFAGGVAPVLVEIPGTDMQGRFAVIDALRPAWPNRIRAVSLGLPADRAGLEGGDVIVAIDGSALRNWEDLKAHISRSAGVELELLVGRGDSTFTTMVTPDERTVSNPITGEDREEGWIGIGPDIDVLRIDYGPVGAVGVGLSNTYGDVLDILITIKGMFVGTISTDELGGPILIAQASGQIAQLGIVPLIAFMALLSVNLAVLNMLPIPVLDGGHMVFLMLEGLRGKPLSLKWRMRLTQAGMLALLALFVLVFKNDIMRLIG
jgi:regulator of sigma E protease